MYILTIIIGTSVLLLSPETSLEKCTAAKTALLAMQVQALCSPASEYLK